MQGFLQRVCDFIYGIRQDTSMMDLETSDIQNIAEVGIRRDKLVGKYDLNGRQRRQ